MKHPSELLNPTVEEAFKRMSNNNDFLQDRLEDTRDELLIAFRKVSNLHDEIERLMNEIPFLKSETHEVQS